MIVKSRRFFLQITKKNHNNDFFLHTILFVTLLQFLQLNTTNCHGWYQDKTGNPITDNILFISCNIEHCMRQYLKSLTSLPILGLKLLNRLFEMLLQFGKPWSPKHSLGFGQHCKSCFFYYLYTFLNFCKHHINQLGLSLSYNYSII